MSGEDTKEKTESSGLFGSFLSQDTAQKAWGFWESVKANPKLQQAQQQAQEAWKSYDKEKVKQKLVELGNSATTYIDEADRKLESLENEALTYLQQRGAEIVDRVKEKAIGPEHEGEVLFSGPEKTSVSRLDAEIMSLNASPQRILEAATTTAAAAAAATKPTASTSKVGIPSAVTRREWLAKSAELEETYNSLVPAQLDEEKFWLSYAAVRSELELHDQRRKQLINSQDKSALENDGLDDWGSSDEEEPANSTNGTSATGTDKSKSATKAETKLETKPEAKSEAKSEAKPAESNTKTEKRIEDEGSDSDWE